MVAKFLREIDVLGIKFHLYSGKALKRSTAFGGFLTILLGIITIILFIIFGNNFFYKKHPSVTMSVENTLSYEYFDLRQENVLFAFRIEDYDAHFIDTSNILYFKIYYYTTEEGTNGEYHSIIKDEFLPYHVCNDSDFPDVNLTKTYGKLYCPELGGKKFGGYWDSNNLYYFEIQVFFCEDGAQYSASNPKCTSLDTLREFLNQDDPKFFALYYPLVEFNPLSYNEPLIRRYKNYYYCLSYRLQRNDDLFLKKTIMNDDKGWLLNEYKNITKWGVDSFRNTYAYFSDEDLTKEGSSTKIYEINLYTSMEKNYYTRYYMKIQNVIAITGSIINVVAYFFESLSHFIGSNILKIEVIKHFFYFEKKSERNFLLLHKSISTPYIKSNKKSKFYPILSNIENQKYINKNILSTPPNFTTNEKEENNSINTDKEKKKFKMPLKKYSHNNFINNNIVFNNFMNDSSIKKNKINKSSFEQSDIEMINKIHKKNMKPTIGNYFNLYDEDISLKNFLIQKFKMRFFFCCYKKSNYSNYLKKQSYNILDWYYINLIQSSKYFEISKQFDFLKKLILNEGQNNSLFLLKKINLRKNEDIVNIINTKNNEIENSVISYFRNIISPENASKTDYMIFDNLSMKIKNKI